MTHRKFLLLAAILAVVPAMTWAQGSHSFKINEVMVWPDSDSYVDENGDRNAWIEVINTSWGTNNLHNCYFTTNRAVLNPNLTVPQRISLMSLIPKGDPRTELKAKQMLVFFADGRTNRGLLHLNFKLTAGRANFIALYDGNGVTLLDSITVPPLKQGQSYARQTDKDGNPTGWKIEDPAHVTAGAQNAGAAMQEDKVREWKEKDPHGVSMTIISMGIVFGCLLILYLFFSLFGIIMRKSAKASEAKTAGSTATHGSSAETNNQNTDNMNEIMAAIAMALHDSQEIHDVESGKITIVRRTTDWNRRRFI